MNILIAHPSQRLRERLIKEISLHDAGFGVSTATSLTDTYNLAEHTQPDCVLVAAELAACPEFELLASLFGIMGIACIILTSDPAPSRLHAAYPTIPQVSEHALEGQIFTAIRKAIRTDRQNPNTDKPERSTGQYDPEKLVLLGASTGGIDALLQVTQHFHDDCPPALVVQHTGGVFAKSLIRLLNSACPATVVAAEDGKPIRPGQIYLAPDDQHHLTLSSRGKPHIRLQPGAAVSGHRPSIDMLFTSAQRHARHVTAALLTGMGKDGAAGLTQLRAAGAYTIGQDKSTSVVYGMPRVAMEMGGVCKQLPIEKIGPALLQACRTTARA